MKIYEESDASRWNELVDSILGGTVFHRWEWLKIAEKHSKSRLYPLVCLDDIGVPFGIFPLFYSRRGPLKMVFSPPPGCAMRLGPILTAAEPKQHRLEHLYREFQEETDRFIKGMRANYIFIDSSPGLNDVRPFIWSNYDVTPAYTYKIDLTQGEAGVWSAFQKKLRSDILRTEKRGVSIREGSGEDLAFLHESVDNRYRAQNMHLLLSKEYLDDLFQQFGGSHIRISVAQSENTVLGAIIHLVYKDTVSVWHGVAKSDVSGLAVNDLIQWKSIQWAIRNGFKKYELMGANTPRLCEFKSKYSPELDLYFIIKKADLLGKMAEQFYLLTTGRK